MALIKKLQKLNTTLSVAFLLARRQIFRGNFWVNFLIVVVMVISILNLIGVSGILVGLLEGSFRANRQEFSGDVYINTLADENSIENTAEIIQILDSIPQINSYSVRYKSPVSIEANYLTRRDFNTLPNRTGISLTGIIPENEDIVTNISNSLVEGEMLRSSQSGYVLLGSTLLARYSAFSDLFEPLVDVYPGTKVKLTVNGNVAEFTVKGILKSKVDEVSTGAYVTEADYRRLTGQTSLQAQEIAILRNNAVTDEQLKTILLEYELDEYARVRTATEAIPKFLDDIKQVFGLLGAVIGGIGLIVASITIFIVIYINALTRRKFIGILKGIGISRRSIEYAYVMQSLFYAVVGSAIALSVIYFVGVPYFEANPLNFPFSDGILVAPASSTISRIITLFIITLIAGFLPAWLIVRRNTLDSILLR
jgi:putative ABC transport system permease protein